MRRDRPVRRWWFAPVYDVHDEYARLLGTIIIIMADGRNGEQFLGIKTNTARIKTNRHDAFSERRSPYVLDDSNPKGFHNILLLNARIGYVLYSIL